MQLIEWLTAKQEEKFDEPSSLTVWRKINRMVSQKGRCKIGTNGERLINLEGPAAISITLMMMRNRTLVTKYTKTVPTNRWINICHKIDVKHRKTFMDTKFSFNRFALNSRGKQV